MGAGADGKLRIAVVCGSDVTAIEHVINARPQVSDLAYLVCGTADAAERLGAYETSLEELKASNEEVSAINEELRSATEELETSKEELQSVNEELTTLNHELKDKVAQITRANSDLQNLITSTEIAVLFLDRKLAIKRFTPRAQDLFNIIPGDLGRPFAHLTHRLEDPNLVADAAQVIQDLRATEREITTHEGRRYLARFLPARSLDDRIEGVVLTFVDITERERAKIAHARSAASLRTAEERLLFALESAPIAIIVLDGSLRTSWAFVNGQELAAIQRQPADIFDDAQSGRFMAMATEAFEARAGRRLELDVRLDGRLRTYDFRIEPGRAGSDIGVTAVGFDITPSKEAERSLIESDRRKDEFSATLSHELRNPLTPMRMAIEVLNHPDADAGKVTSAKSLIDRQLDLFVRLVDDLLDLSRITQGRLLLEPRPVDLARVAETALESVRSLVEEARQELIVKFPGRSALVMGDFERLTQVLTNLLMNATKYTPSGGRIELRVELVGREALVHVSDTGIGITTEMLPHIFEIFVQARDDGRSRGGLGIGLNLVRRLVELHGGRVDAASDGPHQGSQEDA